MGLVFIKEILPKCFVGIWEIKEVSNDFFEQIDLTPSQLSVLKSLKNEKRKLEWLSVRILLKAMLNGKDLEISYDQFGKPFLTDNTSYISISHSVKYTTIMLSKNSPCGIDIQLYKKKILQSLDYFMSETEILQIDNQHKEEIAHAYWCAKEAVYKYAGKSELNLKNDIVISPFSWTEAGEISAKFTYANIDEIINLRYEVIDKNYMLVYTI